MCTAKLELIKGGVHSLHKLFEQLVSPHLRGCLCERKLSAGIAKLQPDDKKAELGEFIVKIERTLRSNWASLKKKMARTICYFF